MSKLEKIFSEYNRLPEYLELPIDSVNSKSHFGNYPLNIASAQGNIEYIHLLEMNGAILNNQGEHGYSPLHDAIEQGHIDAVKILIKLGADPDIRNDDGETAIGLAKLLKEDGILEFFDTLSSK